MAQSDILWGIYRIYLHLCIYSRLTGNNLSEEAKEKIRGLLPGKVYV